MLFVHRFGRYEIISEIVIREKQRAIGAQAIGKEEVQLALELFNVFGRLSPKTSFRRASNLEDAGSIALLEI